MPEDGATLWICVEKATYDADLGNQHEQTKWGIAANAFIFPFRRTFWPANPNNSVEKPIGT